MLIEGNFTADRRAKFHHFVSEASVGSTKGFIKNLDPALHLWIGLPPIASELSVVAGMCPLPHMHPLNQPLARWTAGLTLQHSQVET